MSGSPHPVAEITGITTTDDVSKSAFIAFVKSRSILPMQDVSEVRSTDLAGQLLISLLTTGRIYQLDTSDTTTADDGINCIRDANNLGFFLQEIVGVDGVDGASALTVVRVAATANVAIATALENGDTLDGITLATSDIVLLTAQSAPEQNGAYVVQASGAAVRHTSFDAYNEFPGRYFSVTEGTVNHDTLWQCTSDAGGTIGVTAITLTRIRNDISIPVTLAQGGTGAVLVDPNADRILFWDDSAGNFTFLSVNNSLAIVGTELRAVEVHGIALSDETTAITTGTGKASFSLPYAFTLVGVYVTLNTVSSSGTPTFDFNEAGTTCLSTKVVIDVSEFTGGSSGYQGTAAGAAVISDPDLAAFAQLTWDIDTAGTGAKGAKAYIVGYRA